MPFRELARAKVNLTLTVLGRRCDGYHDIMSLVTFADVADRVTLHPGPNRHVMVRGSFASAIEGPNLLDKAFDLLWRLQPDLQLGTVELEKALPVAAGLGGGSADAAALLRAVQRANPNYATTIDWYGLAARLGADVPVCLAGTPSLMRGIGDRIEPLPPSLAPLACVLVNPRVPLATARVFAAFASAEPALGDAPRAESDAQGA
ncbi:MAG: 4-(cytidine 5'-diphospho)-2-C-methyl-D-erythritol kinase, partial [Hyphomicrobiaceae bacterium]|nr:4-(cytidine 5'-diphospho)-2-C-methyl-D-erythritol kinase [Hyphomicrobiaceae bacterium]